MCGFFTSEKNANGSNKKSWFFIRQSLPKFLCSKIEDRARTVQTEQTKKESGATEVAQTKLPADVSFLIHFGWRAVSEN